MNDYIYLGSTPSEEECAQVGTNDYQERARKEIHAYMNQLDRVLTTLGYPKEKRPDTFSLVRKSESHDFGTYYEVCAKVREGDETAYELAILIENNSPAEWDEEARKELGLTSDS